MRHQIQFGLQHTVQGERISDAWHDVVAEQARLLEQILHQLHETLTELQHSSDAGKRQRTRLNYVFEEASRLLTSRAQHHASLENQIATIRGSFSPANRIPPGAEKRLRMMELVNATMHANLARARQQVALLRQANM
jgi:hypothetical protein